MSIPSDHRLRKHSEFELVYRCGRRHFSTILTAFYLLRTEGSGPNSAARPGTGTSSHSSTEPRVGITVGRALGKATIRNRIKRRTRAAVTQSLGKLTRPVDVVINPKKAVLEIDFQQLCSEIARAFHAIEQKAVPADLEQSEQKERTRQSTTRPERLAVRKT